MENGNGFGPFRQKIHSPLSLEDSRHNYEGGEVWVNNLWDFDSISFDLPIDIKKRNTEVIPNSGYVAPTEFSRFFKGLGIYDFGSPHSVDVFCSQRDIPPHQRFFFFAQLSSILVFFPLYLFTFS